MSESVKTNLNIDALKIKNIYWEKEWKIPNTPWTIRGYSRSAYRTGFYIPELKLMLDAGPQNFNKPNYILITHTHIDHVACLPLTMIGDEKGSHVFHIYGPEESKEYIHNYIHSMFSLNNVGEVDCREWYKYYGIGLPETFFDKLESDRYRENMNKNAYRSGLVVRIVSIDNSNFSINSFSPYFYINSGKEQVEVEVFKCDHRVPTVGYGLQAIKYKLKDEYLHLSGKEICELKKNGVEITNRIKTPLLAYVCDTSIEVFNLNKHVLEYKTIFIECTFFMDDEIENANATKHIHWSQLKEYVIGNINTLFVLFHFSQRYKDQEINEFFQKEKDSGMSNIYWWTNE